MANKKEKCAYLCVSTILANLNNKIMREVVKVVESAPAHPRPNVRGRASRAGFGLCLVFITPRRSVIIIPRAVQTLPPSSTLGQAEGEVSPRAGAPPSRHTSARLPSPRSLSVVKALYRPRYDITILLWVETGGLFGGKA